MYRVRVCFICISALLVCLCLCLCHHLRTHSPSYGIFIVNQEEEWRDFFSILRVLFNMPLPHFQAFIVGWSVIFALYILTLKSLCCFDLSATDTLFGLVVVDFSFSADAAQILDESESLSVETVRMTNRFMFLLSWSRQSKGYYKSANVSSNSCEVAFDVVGINIFLLFFLSLLFGYSLSTSRIDTMVDCCRRRRIALRVCACCC